MQELTNGIKSGKYKYEYDSDRSEIEIENLLNQGRIKIKNENCHMIPNDIFQKKRNGLIKSPTIKENRRQSK